jgi:alkanesulfonate monooxygenase SsuD/methylene tetrahydromethanopterin reductase-like flavin-dependent oxidoreductase (luciferase family)
MRFGLLYEHQLPRPWAPGAEHRLLDEALEQIALADRLGFAVAWSAEHHFREEGAHGSAPAVLLAAAAARTRAIRLGLAGVPVAAGFGHPARLAAEIATLDLISGGRVELATSEGAAGIELGGFGVDRDRRRAAWEEGLDVLTRMWVEEPFGGWEGAGLAMPPRQVLPRPLQRPHPPLWLACRRRDQLRLAAEKGLGALSLAPVEPDEAALWVAEHEAVMASEHCVPAGFRLDGGLAVVLPMHVHADEAEAIERGLDGAHFTAYARAHFEVFGDHRPGGTRLWEEFLARRGEVGFSRSAVTADGGPLKVAILRDGTASLRGAIGTPDQVAELAERYAAAGVEQLVFIVQSGRVPHAHVLESLELFAAEVLPRFAGGAQAAAAARAARVDAARAPALARRPPPRSAQPGWTVGPLDDGAGHGGAAGRGSPPPPRTPPPRAPAAPAGQASRSAAVPAGSAGRVGARLRRAATSRGEKAFRTFVRRSDDRRLERTVGTRQGLRVIFSAMQGQFVPSGAGGFTGDLLYELRGADGALLPWTVTITPDRAVARPGRPTAPRLTVKITVADFVRLAGGDLDAGRALLSGRMDLEGDFSLAARLGEMFGQGRL